ncbi:hypothetical protein GCM10025865_24820 [Paraoerskovia sediminicola]|uniref:leucine--tRNA ligase n=1 Tax=Paraoerskovia sediminicola TaxID=1138587 RepID=A0ABN6XE17_9CELL|nr:hypothetical protein GCM10025865_24820 [Paraoerskovia sediminicola]
MPVFTADYVLMGYGTGAIMAVPGGDQRDFEFARAFELPVIYTVAPGGDVAAIDQDAAYTGDGVVVNSAAPSATGTGGIQLDGLDVPTAKRTIIDWLEAQGAGESTVTYRLRDWLFSRQRYWGEPFPIVYDADDRPVAIPDAMLPVDLPDVPDYAPRTYEPDDADSSPEPPLGRNDDWVHVTLDLGDGPQQYRRDTNTMPNWAGSCWYYLRYLDPTDSEQMVDPKLDDYWLGPNHNGTASVAGGVDLYVGGVEHAVLHLLYARFWHKALYDLGKVTSREPFGRLFNQGYVQAYAYTDARGAYVPADDVVEGKGDDGEPVFTYQGAPVNREYGKMGKSLKNVVTPDDMYAAYGADTFRVYEMSMGPLDLSRPWETRAVVGSQRFLQRLWRNVVDEESGALTVSDDEPDTATLRAVHRAIADVTVEMEDAPQHRDRQAHRPEQPPDVARLGAARRRRATRAHDRAVRPAPRRGAVVAARARHVARPRAVPRGRRGVPRRGHRDLRAPGAGQGPRSHRGAAVDLRRRPRGARARRPRDRAQPRRARRAQGDRPRTEARQHRPGLTWLTTWRAQVRTVRPVRARPGARRGRHRLDRVAPGRVRHALPRRGARRPDAPGRAADRDRRRRVVRRGHGDHR